MLIPERHKVYTDAVLDYAIPGKSILRSMAKTVTWRILATVDTFVLSWLITGNLTYALGIAGFEVLTKMVLYFFHERAWARVGKHRYPPKKRRVRIDCRNCGTTNSKVVTEGEKDG